MHLNIPQVRALELWLKDMPAEDVVRDYMYIRCTILTCRFWRMFGT